MLHEFPPELYQYCGKGLFHWQYPNQFSKYLTYISKFNVESYMEIGVRWGGTFLITVEYLNKFHPIKKAIGFDIIDCPSIAKYKELNDKVDYKKMYSNSEEFKEYINSQASFDLVLIDGDHSEKGCMDDFRTIKDKAKVLVFHDIASDVCPGVKNVWNTIKENYKEEYYFKEFKDQYESVRKTMGINFLGIGVAVKK